MKSSPPLGHHTGTLSHFMGFLNSTVRYLGARLKLVGLEAKEAGAQYGIAAAMIVGGLLVAILGYVFLVTMAVFGVAAAFDGKHAWILVMGGAALLHLGGAAALIFVGLRQIRTGSFSTTLEGRTRRETLRDSAQRGSCPSARMDEAASPT